MAKAKKQTLYTKTITLPDGTRKYIRASTKAALDEKVFKIKAELSAGIDVCNNATFGEFTQMWVDIYKRPYLRDSGLNSMLWEINHYIMPYLGALPLRDIKALHIQMMMAELSSYSHRTQSKVLSTTRAILNAAVDNNIIMRSPVPVTLKAYGARTEEKVPLTKEQSDRLLAAVKGTRAYILVVLMLGLGLRREEALGIMWADIDFDTHLAHIQRTNVICNNKSIVSTAMKSKAAKRDIPMQHWVEMALLEWRAESPMSLYVAPGADGRPMTPSAFRSAWAVIKARTVEDPKDLGTSAPKHPQIVRTLDFYVHPHLLRHTCITRWVEAGLNMEEVQYLAGHSSAALTMEVYAHYDKLGQFAETTKRLRAQA